MSDAWMSGAGGWRLGAFALVFLIMAGWELVEPWRTGAPRRSRRWPTNFALAAIDAFVLRLVLPVGAIGVAWLTARRGWGLLHLLPIPGWAAGLLAVLALDLAIYGQHVAFHAVPWLWRLHRVHHADEHMDASTGVRFHPVEALLSLAWKVVTIVLLGASPGAVFLFELLLNLSSLFNHGNVSLPGWLEPPARWLVVTPGMHRVHHSCERTEHDSNFGFNLSWWDRLFDTYRAEAAAGNQIRFGLPELWAQPTHSLPWALRAPFGRAPAGFERTEPGTPAPDPTHPGVGLDRRARR